MRARRYAHPAFPTLGSRGAGASVTAGGAAAAGGEADRGGGGACGGGSSSSSSSSSVGGDGGGAAGEGAEAAGDGDGAGGGGGGNARAREAGAPARRRGPPSAPSRVGTCRGCLAALVVSRCCVGCAPQRRCRRALAALPAAPAAAAAWRSADHAPRTRVALAVHRTSRTASAPVQQRVWTSPTSAKEDRQWTGRRRWEQAAAEP